MEVIYSLVDKVVLLKSLEMSLGPCGFFRIPRDLRRHCVVREFAVAESLIVTW